MKLSRLTVLVMILSLLAAGVAFAGKDLGGDWRRHPGRSYCGLDSGRSFPGRWLNHALSPYRRVPWGGFGFRGHG